MRKALYHGRNILFFVVTVLFIISFSNILSGNFNRISLPNMLSLYIYLVLNLFFVGYLLIEYMLHLKTVDDNRFHILFIFVHFLMIIVYIRTYFDTSMVSVYLNQLGDMQYLGLNTNFLLDNMVYFDIAYVALLIYMLVNCTKKKKQA